MTLSINSVLHYWDARYGEIPIVGGAPTHSRASAGRWVDNNGVVQSAIVNTPRKNWAALAGERRQTLSLEQARTNYLLQSEDFSSGSWTKETGVTIAANNVLAPDGTLTADKISTTSLGSGVYQASSQPAVNGQRAVFSIWLRAPVNSSVDLTINRVGGFDGMTTTVVATSKWQRFAVGHTGSIGAASNWQVIVRQTSGAGGATEIIWAWGAQLEIPGGTTAGMTVGDAAGAAAYIPTTSSTASRAADSFCWDFVPPPQGMMVYLRFVERGTQRVNSGRLLEIGASAGATPRFVIAQSSGFYAVIALFTAGTVQSTIAAFPSSGDVVELVAVLNPTGVVDIYQSINGAAPTQGGVSAGVALDAAWSDAKLWLNSIGASFVGLSDFADVKLVKLADVVSGTVAGRMDEMRAFELNAAGEVINPGS